MFRAVLRLVLMFGVAATLAGSGSALAQGSGTVLASMSGVDWLNRIEMLQKSQRQAGERPWVRAQVRNVNLQRGELTISHGEIKSIDMPAMSMTFPVADTNHLRMVKVGDEVEVQAADQGGVVRIVTIRMGH